MIKHLQNIVKYTQDTGFFEYVLTGVKDDGNAMFTSVSKDQVLRVKAVFKTPIPELAGNKIGMTRLDVLSAYLRSEAFAPTEDTTPEVTVEHNTKNDSLIGLRLKSTYGHSCFYRFMTPVAAKHKITIVRSQTEISDSDISFNPSEKFLRDFQSFAGVLKKFNSNFSLEVNDQGMLYMNLGSDDTAKLPVCQVGTDKNINETYTWSIDNFLRILKLAPSLEMVTCSVSEEYGMIEIVIDDENVKATYTLLHN